MNIQGFTNVNDDLMDTIETNMVSASEMDVNMPPAQMNQAFLAMTEKVIAQATDIQTTLRNELAPKV